MLVTEAIKWVGSCRAPQGARGLKSAWGCFNSWLIWSRPARGAWVEIAPPLHDAAPRASRPARGAWVEIARCCRRPACPLGRAPQGVRGLKCFHADSSFWGACRAPQGARGLKFYVRRRGYVGDEGRAPQGARGLKSRTSPGTSCPSRSRLEGGVWIETLPDSHCRIPP